MASRTQRYVSLGLLGAALALGGCGRDDEDADLAQLDNQLTANQTDPALNSALQDQILVDPSLSQQSNRNAVRAPGSPVQAQYPAGANSGDGGCAAGEFDHSPSWANRLPAPFVVFPGSNVTEAAANNDGDCRMRVVTFVSNEAPGRLLDWYQTRVQGAGFSAERQSRDGDQILAGTDPSGGAYYLIVTPRAHGADVALITNKGI